MRRSNYEPLWNHATRGTLATETNLMSGTSSRSNTSTSTRFHPYAQGAHSVPEEEFYDLPFEYEDGEGGGMGSAPTPDEDLEGSAAAPVAGPAGITVLPHEKAKRYENSACPFIHSFKAPPHCNFQDAPLKTWVDYREHYIDEMMGLEGRGRLQASCAGCNIAHPIYRCKDCLHGCLWCSSCILEKHRMQPLHMIEVWKSLCHSVNLLMLEKLSCGMVCSFNIHR